MNEISETQSKLDELMNEYEVAVIGENRGRNRSGYSEKADKYYQKRRELKEFVARLEAERRWIPVSERLPEDGEVVWLWDGNNLGMGYYLVFSGQFMDRDTPLRPIKPSHWVPLPEPPIVYGKEREE